jgi:hypothetical protein
MRILTSLILLFLLTLPLQAAEFVFSDEAGGVLGIWTPKTGTSTDAYPSPCQGEWTKAYQFNKKVIWVANTGGSNAITVKILVYPDADGDSWILPVNGNTENSITAGNGLIANIPESVEKIDVCIKSTSAGNHSTFTTQPSASKRED